MSQRILVWDVPTRVFHWLLVLSFSGAFLTADGALPRYPCGARLHPARLNRVQVSVGIFRHALCEVPLIFVQAPRNCCLFDIAAQGQAPALCGT